MINLERVINVFDAVCDCLPVVSTLTNGAQLLYQLARKVDATANPVKTSWTDDFKIHVINKSKIECLIGMVPIFGNITRLITLIRDGFRDQLLSSIRNNKIESAKLYLSRHPLNDDQKAKSVLVEATRSSEPELFELIFNSRTWDIDALMKALVKFRLPDESEEKKTNLIVDYYESNFKDSVIPEEYTGRLILVFQSYIRLGYAETANRILNILKPCNFLFYKDVLANLSYPTFNTILKGTLNQDQIEAIINRCKDISLYHLTEYCIEVPKKAQSLERDLDLNNNKAQYDSKFEMLNTQEIMDGFYEVHHGIIQKLLNLVTENTLQLVDCLSKLASNGQIQLLEMFLEKYENQLNSEKKLRVLKGTDNLFQEEPALKGFEYLFTKFNHDLTNEHCNELLKYFSDSYRNKTLFINKMIEIRPDLKELVA